MLKIKKNEMINAILENEKKIHAQNIERMSELKDSIKENVGFLR